MKSERYVALRIALNCAHGHMVCKVVDEDDRPGLLRVIKDVFTPSHMGKMSV